MQFSNCFTTWQHHGDYGAEDNLDQFLLLSFPGSVTGFTMRTMHHVFECSSVQLGRIYSPGQIEV